MTFLALSKYIMLFMLLIYIMLAFLAISFKKSEFISSLEWLIIIVFHLTGYIVISVSFSDIKYMLLYSLQLIFIYAITKLYRFVYNDISKPLYNNMMMLIVIGLIMVARLSMSACIRQCMFIGITLFVGLFVPFIIERAKLLDKLCIFFCMLGIGTLLLVLVMGQAKYGAKNWLVIGPVMLQPSEFVKIIYVFAIAGILSKRVTFRRIIFTAAVAGAHVLILVAEKDLGGALLFFMTFLIMLFIASGSFVLFGGGLVSLCGLSVVAYKLFSHVRIRVLAFRDPWAVIDNEGYQLGQSLMAIGSGGWFGSGLCNGMPNSIPVVISDFIFAAISEEMGAGSAICIIIIYLCCFLTFLEIALKLEDNFHKLLAMGLSIMFFTQVILTLGGVTGFIPSTGVTLPLISQGGSSAVSVIMLFSIIQGLFAINKKNADKEELEQLLKEVDLKDE